MIELPGEIIDTLHNIVDYMIPNEGRHWEESGKPKKNHIFLDVRKLTDFLQSLPAFEVDTNMSKAQAERAWQVLLEKQEQYMLMAKGYDDESPEDFLELDITDNEEVLHALEKCDTFQVWER